MDPGIAKALESLTARLGEEATASWLAVGAVDPGSLFTERDLERLLYRSGAPINLIRDGDRRNQVRVADMAEALPH
ncbi:MAG: hypothetical protein ACREC5_06410, partial [Thermoplasmata archaeon]